MKLKGRERKEQTKSKEFAAALVFVDEVEKAGHAANGLICMAVVLVRRGFPAGRRRPESVLPLHDAVSPTTATL